MKRKKIVAHVFDDGSVVKVEDFLGVDEEYILSFGKGILYKNEAELRLIRAIVKIQRQEQKEESHKKKVRAGATPKKKEITKKRLQELINQFAEEKPGETRGWVKWACAELPTTSKTLNRKMTENHLLRPNSI